MSPHNLHIMQRAGGTQYACVFRSNGGPCSIVHGDGYDTFMNETIPQQARNGLTPAQVWRVWDDNGGSRFGGLFRHDTRAWMIAWGNSYDAFNGHRLVAAGKQGMIPTQVLQS